MSFLQSVRRKINQYPMILRFLRGAHPRIYTNKVVGNVENKIIYSYIADLEERIAKLEQASGRQTRGRILQDIKESKPDLIMVSSQAATEDQFEEPDFKRICRDLRREPIKHRKLWEYVYIVRALESAGKLVAGTKGLGFGVGKDPMVALMVAKGCQVTATDMDLGEAQKSGWVSTNQYSQSLEDFNDRSICSMDQLKKNVELRTVDMNEIPLDLKQGQYDFVWSACAFEHLGSLENGMIFVLESLKCLKPGGVAVHTTEFNASSDEETLTSGDTVIYRMRDIKDLAEKIRRNGYEIALNFNLGEGRMDKYYDIPPYSEWNHIKLQLDKYVTTSYGLLIKKPERI